MNDVAGTSAAPAQSPMKTPSSLPSSTEESSPKLYGLLAEFETPGAILSAAKKVHEAGYKWWDCCTPFMVHGLDKAMGIRPTILPWLVLGAGITGGILGMLLQWFTNATNLEIWGGPIWVTGYAFLVSGKPFASIPTWIPVMFELTVLLSAIGTVVFLMLLNKLPQLYHPCFNNERFARVTDDRFFIIIEAKDQLFYRAKTQQLLTSLGATVVEEVQA